MQTVKIKLMDLKEVIRLPLSEDVDINDAIVDNIDGTVNFTVDKVSLQKAIDKFIKTGNTRKSGFPVWLYNTMIVDSNYYYPDLDENVLGEVVKLSIEEDFLYGEVLPLNEAKWKQNESLKVQLAFEPTFNYRTKVLGFERINGIIKILTTHDIEIKENDELLIISKDGIEQSPVQEIENREDGSKRYKVKNLWFTSNGLLVNGRGIRLKHLDGENLL